MARGTQLQQLVTMLRHEIGDSSSVAVGIDEEDSYKNLLRRVQAELYEDFTWPHLVSFKSKELFASQQYYDFPSGMNYEGVREAAVRYNNRPHPVEFGIGFEQYASYDFAVNGEKADPVRAWDVRDVSGAVQFEVWPVPASNNLTLIFKAVRTLGALTADSDLADLDDHLIVLFAASEILERRNSEDAKSKLAKAQGRLFKLRGRASGPAKMITMSGYPAPSAYKRGHTIIRVS